MMINPLATDLDYIFEKTVPLWEELRDQQIFVTGGTGFFGCWLLESFLWAQEKLNLNAKMVVLTRNIAAFSRKHPHLAVDPSLHFIEGDVRNFVYPSGVFSHVIHAATDAIASLNETSSGLPNVVAILFPSHEDRTPESTRENPFLLL